MAVEASDLRAQQRGENSRDLRGLKSGALLLKFQKQFDDSYES